MASPAEEICGYLNARGAKLIGFADLHGVPAAVRSSLPRAVGFAVALDPHIVADITEGPTKAYHGEYCRVNTLLDELSRSVADLLRSYGHTAIDSAPTTEHLDLNTLSTEFPHKTTATLAGLGWIGKCALLVTRDFGAAVRLNRVLTDAPLPTATPITKSYCGDCHVCVDACPGMAPSGNHWARGKSREDFFDAFACRPAARKIAQQRTGVLETFCGICIAVCPWTQAYIKRNVN